jgi:acyl dehydratase
VSVADAGWGVLVTAGVDPAAEARRLERLGFGHLLLPAPDPVPVLLALGATTGLTVLVDGLRGDEPWLGALPPESRRRVAARPVGPATVPVAAPFSPAACASYREALGVLSEATFELCVPAEDRALACQWLALEVLGEASGPTRYGEDFEVGQTLDLGTWSPSLDDIVAFGESYDPLPIHIDPEAAAAFPLGVLCASGMQTLLIMHRLAVLRIFRRTAMVAGRGLLGAQLRRPVRPGMRLRVVAEVREVTLREDGRAVVGLHNTMLDTADGALVAWFDSEALIRRRPD